MDSEMQDGSGGQDILPVKAEDGHKVEVHEERFVWGQKMAGSNFRSVKISGEEYSLYDCIRCHSGSDLDHIGKIMRMWQTEDRKLCNIRWFFRPSELPPLVKGLDYLPDRKELFFASGKVKGVEDENLLVSSNIGSVRDIRTVENDVSLRFVHEYLGAELNPYFHQEVIIGKCRVLCTAEDDYNKLPTSQQLQAADFFFNKAFDCDEMEITGLDILSEDIGAQKVFNKTEWLINKSPGITTLQVSSPRLHCQSSGSGGSPTLEDPAQVPLQQGQKVPAKLKVEDARTLKASMKRRRNETKGSPAQIVENKSGRASPDFKKSKVDKSSPSVVPGEEHDEHMLESRKSMIHTSDAQPQSGGNLGLETSRVKNSPQVAALDIRSEPVPNAGKGGVLKSPSSAVPQLQTKTVLKGEGVHPNRSVKKLENPTSGIVNKIAPRPPGTDLLAGNENPGKLDKRPDKGKMGNLRQDAGPVKGRSIVRDEPNLFKKPGLASKRKDYGKTVTTMTMPLEKKLRPPANSNATKDIEKIEREGYREQSEHGGRNSLLVSGSLPPGKVGIHGVVSTRKEDLLQVVTLESEITAPTGKVDGVTFADREHRAKSEEQEPPLIPRRPLFKVNLEVWEDSIERAVRAKRVLLLKNVDPIVHSKDLEESLTQFFKTRCEVRKAPGLTFNYYDSAAALLKLPTPKKAEEILQSMEDDCLVLGDRPVIATLFECTQFLKEFPKFPGHLDIQQKRDREDHRNALATSHAAQGNTIEFTYGQPWRLLQEQHDIQWNILRELHQKELSVFDSDKLH